jgi:hypothetical protein
VGLVAIDTEGVGDPGHRGLDPVRPVAGRQTELPGAEGDAGATDELQLVEIGIRGGHPTIVVTVTAAHRRAVVS